MQAFTDWLIGLAHQLPLELFVFAGTFIEEVVAPIPTPLILGTAGFLAREQLLGILYFAWLATWAATAKTIASYFFYWLGQLARHRAPSHWQKRLGLEPHRLTHLHLFLSQSWWDDLVLIGVRVLPIIPSFLVSLGAGAVQLPLRVFLVTTFIGNWIRSLTILALGAYATDYAVQLWQESQNTQFFDPMTLLAGGIGLVIGAILALLIRRKLFAAPPPKSPARPRRS